MIDDNGLVTIHEVVSDKSRLTLVNTPERGENGYQSAKDFVESMPWR
jgi:hypothetical protein